MTSINNLTSTDELDPTDQFPLWSGVNGASRKIAYGDFLSELMKDTNPMTTLGDVIFGIAKGVQARLPIGVNGQVLGVVGGVPAWTAAGGGGSSVAGSDKQIQYNASGAFGAEAGFEYDYTSNTLTVQNATYTGLALTAASATGGAGFRLPHGAAPTSPTNGDVWTTTAGVFARVNGATVGPFGTGAGSFTGGTLTSALNEAPTVALSSAATVNIGAAAGNTVTVSGTTTITAFDTIAAGAIRRVRFLAALTFTHNATSLILPGSANITTAAGDVATMESLGSGNWRCVNYSKGDGTSLVGGGGGGLTNWTDTVNTATPNATIPVPALTVNNAATNVDAAIVVKGTGALLGAIPDNTATGGNKRGTNATDWQRNRNTNTQVASGATSTVGGGGRNTASGSNSTVAGGFNNTATTTDDAVCGGNTNTASGGQSYVGGGTSNTASGNYATIGGGNLNTAAGNYASIGGGFNNVASGIYSSAFGSRANARSITGALVHAAGIISASGDCQVGRYVLSQQTSNATPTALTVGAQTAGANTLVVLPNGSTYDFTINVVARVNGGATTASWKIEGTIKRDSGGVGTTALVGTPVVTARGAVGSAISVAAVADTTNGSLNVQVTGFAATTINWVALVETVECIA